MKISCAMIGGLALVAVVSAQGTDALQFEVRTEARRQPNAAVTPLVERSMETILPDGYGSVTYLTDGRSVKATVHNQMFGFAPATVRLVQQDDPREFVLTPARRMYAATRDRVWEAGSDEPRFTVNASDETKTLLGYQARRVHVSYQQRIRIPGTGNEPTESTQEISAVIDNWCTSDLEVPQALVRMIDMVGRLSQGGLPSYQGQCPFALQSVASISVLPGIEIVTTVESVSRPPNVSDHEFEIPDGFTLAVRESAP